MRMQIECVCLFLKAAEQAKASPALVAKDPSTSTNKKEEEDLAKGEKHCRQLRNFTDRKRFI